MRLNRWQSGVLAVLAGALVFLGLHNGLGKGDWSGWVQAVGSIATVGVGAWAVQWQVREQGQAERRLLVQRDIAPLASIAELLRYAASRLDAVYALMDDAEHLARYLAFRMGIDELHHVRTALEETALADVSEPGMKLAFLSGREAFIEAHKLLVHIRKDYPNSTVISGSGRLHRWRGEIAGYQIKVSTRANEIFKRIDALADSVAS